MRHLVSHKHQDGVLHFVTSGRMNSGENVGMWHHVHAIAHEHQAKRILIECAADSGRISMAHCLELIEKIPLLCRRLACKVALFEKHMGEETRDLLTFVENAATDRGAHFKHFSELEEARLWLNN